MTGVGDEGREGARGARAPSPNSRKNIFGGNYYVKFEHFSGKNHVKLWNFVNFQANIVKIRVF